jgi:hypothetical protein
LQPALAGNSFDGSIDGGSKKMAWLNVRESAWKGYYRVTELLKKWDIHAPPHHVAGHIQFMWHDSQEALRTSGTTAELIEWLRLDDINADDQPKWIAALIKAGFLSQLYDVGGESTDSFSIKGNEEEIEARVTKAKTSAKGGEATKRKWEQIKADGRLAASQQHRPQASRDHAETGHNTSQGKAIQSNSIQDNTTQEVANATSAVAETARAVADVAGKPKQVIAETAPFKPVDIDDLIAAIPAKSKQRWMQLYEDTEFLRRETIKAMAWYENNPRKYPKNLRGWVAALSSWFERSWKHHVRAIPGTAPPGGKQVQSTVTMS